MRVLLGTEMKLIYLEKEKKMKKRIGALLLGVSLFASAMPLTIGAIAAKADDEVDKKVTIIAGSDFQATNVQSGKRNMNLILSSMAKDGITSADAFFFCGDYDVDTMNNAPETEAGINGVIEVAETVTERDNIILLQGNHDTEIGSLGMSYSGNNDPMGGEYGVFVINEDDYMWGSGNEELTRRTAQGLTDYLNDKIEDDYAKPIFVLSHVPLHYSMRTKTNGDGYYASYIFDILNQAGDKGLNIFFLFGHNHNSGWDDYIGGSSVFLTRDDTILIAQSSTTEFKSEILNFTYFNAGYVGYCSSPNGADEALTMTAFEIDSDSVLFKRYDKNGIHNLKSVGIRNTAKDETAYDPNTKVYESPQDILLVNEIEDELIVSPWEKVVEVKSNQNLITYKIQEDSLVISLIPDSKYCLSTLTLNGESIDISAIIDNEVVVRAREFNTINASFEQATKYKLTIENDSAKGTVKKNISAFDYYEGQALVLTVEAKEGYEVSKVTFNGTELQKNANGKYDIAIVAGENVLKTEYTTIGGSDASSNDESTSVDTGGADATTDSSESGCGSTIGVGTVALVILLAGGLALVKRKEN